METTSAILGGSAEPALLAGGCVLAIARLPARVRLPPHTHEHATLNVVLHGNYGEAVERRGLESYGPATLIAKPPGASHWNQLGPDPAECLVVELKGGTFVTDFLVRRSADIARYGGRLRAELARQDDLRLLIVEGFVAELLGAVALTRSPRPESGRAWLLRVRDLLHDNPGPLSLTMIAARVGLHPIYVARAFRARFGCSVGEYARVLRVERARRLLHHTGLALSEVALRTGFADQSHLTRDFRRAFEQSPAAYRSLVRGR